MKTFIAIFTFTIVLLSHSAYAQETASPKHSSIDLYDEARSRPAKVDIWYPEGAECKALICLAESVKTDKLIMLSHGSMGAAKDLNWLGYAVASQGFVAVGLNHYGESWVYGSDTIDPSVIADASLRPGDASFVLDTLAQNEDGQGAKIFSEAINTQNTTITGHSAGGATAFMLAGAQPDAQLAYNYCAAKAAKSDRSCAYIQHMPEPKGAMLMPKQIDARFTNIIALDPAMGHAMNVTSIESIKLPTLVVGSVANDFLVYEQHAAKYAKYIKGATLIGLDNGEGHFVYLDVCQHQHQALGVAICKDRDGVDRKAIHQQLYQPIFEQLYRY